MKHTLTLAALFLAAGCGSSTSGDTTPNTDPTATEDSTEATPTETTAEQGKDFTLTDANGNEVSLADYQGKTVVLEWFNPGCPYIVYAHGEGPLKTMPSEVTTGGEVAWLAINSGKTAEAEMNQKAITDWGMEVPVLLDPTGSVGKAYGAKSTPHMFILDGDGEVVYQGALDNAPRGEKDGEYVNYVKQALDEIAAGSQVSMAETQSYGCGVKY